MSRSAYSLAPDGMNSPKKSPGKKPSGKSRSTKRRRVTDQGGRGQPAPEVVPEDASRSDLLAAAKRQGIEHRSEMSNDELRTSLAARGDDVGVSEWPASRFEAFELLARASARGEFVMLPRMLCGDDRRRHVRQTLREDHQTRIARNDLEAQRKFDKLAGSLFSFFRGTALLFYRDMAGQDAWMPTVMSLGDVHPANFGVMPNEDGVAIFGVNDFDESAYAPFTWDLKRGATGFLIAAEVEGQKPKNRRRIVRSFVRGYIEQIRTYATRNTEGEEQTRIDNAPKMIAKLIKNALESRAKWLADDYLNEYGTGFRNTDELVPISRRREEFQDLVDAWVKKNEIAVPERAISRNGTGEMVVKDVAMRRGQGTASLGLPRYYVMIEGPNADGTDDLIIEFKQARRSALHGLVPPTTFNGEVMGERVVHAHEVQLVRGDVFFGSIDFEDKSFLSRERPPFKDDVDLEELSKKGWRKYARICGHALAQAHALSDDMGSLDYDVEPAILKAIEPEDLFVGDITRYAKEAAARVRRDHKAFREDHARRAFENIDIAYR